MKHEDRAYELEHYIAKQLGLASLNRPIRERIHTIIGEVAQDYHEKAFFNQQEDIENLVKINEKLDKRCDRDDVLILKMKDEISKLKMTVNNLRQKLEARK